MLSNPLFYISAYLERNRDEYYKRLLEISRYMSWDGTGCGGRCGVKCGGGGDGDGR